MQQHGNYLILIQFFEANNVNEILERSPHILDVQLTIERDKKYMNRPFLIGTILRRKEGVNRIRGAYSITNPGK